MRPWSIGWGGVSNMSGRAGEGAASAKKGYFVTGLTGAVRDSAGDQQHEY